jgi:tight adherence protein B
MVFIILLLTFGSAALLVNEFIPLGGIWVRLWKKKHVDSTQASLDRMFYRVSSKRIALMVSLFPLAMGVFGFLSSRHPLGAIIGFFVGAVIPNTVMKQMEAKRKMTFDDQLVDGMMIVSSSLKAGLSLLQALESLVEEMPVPISQEFGLLVNENRMGVPFEECAQHLKDRVRSEDLDMIVTAILVARETGGDLTETFTQLVYTIREKKKLDRKIRTLTVQGRLQGIIMAILPIGFAIFLYKIQPQTFEVMLKEEMGRILLVYAFISWVVGALLIRKFCKVDF